MRRHGGDGFSLGGQLGSYPVAGVGGGLAQVARRIGVVLYVVVIVCLVAIAPPAAFAKGAVMTAVVFVLSGLMLGWRRLSAAYGLRRCHLYTGGLVIMTFHRVEIARRGLGPLAYLAMGMKPPLVDALVSRLARSGIR